jgi:hypothetical protein
MDLVAQALQKIGRDIILDLFWAYNTAWAWSSMTNKVLCSFQCVYILRTLMFSFNLTIFWFVKRITTAWCCRHLVYALELTECLFWCIDTGEARPSSQGYVFFWLQHMKWYLNLISYFWIELGSYFDEAMFIASMLIPILYRDYSVSKIILMY